MESPSQFAADGTDSNDNDPPGDDGDSNRDMEAAIPEAEIDYRGAVEDKNAKVSDARDDGNDSSQLPFAINGMGRSECHQ